MDADDPLFKFLPIIKDSAVPEDKIYIINTLRLHDISIVPIPDNPYCYIQILNDVPEWLENNKELWENANKQWMKTTMNAYEQARRDQEEAEKPFRKRVKSSYEALRRLLWKRPCR